MCSLAIATRNAAAAASGVNGRVVWLTLVALSGST
jgi:hypothetical protein